MVNDETRGLGKQISDLNTTVASGFATLNTRVDLMKESHDRVATKVDEMKTAQDGCPARTGLNGINARLGKLEKKSSDNKINVRAELAKAREDQTGSIEEAALIAAKAVVAPRSNGILGTFGWRGLFQVLFYLLAAAFIAGMYVRGADEAQVEQVIQNVREINRAVDKVKQDMEEPIAVPVPVTPAECVSEEIAP